jgi:hypothetical protein
MNRQGAKHAKKSKGGNRRGAEVAEETQRKAITAKARRRKEKPQRTSEFLISFCVCFPLRSSAPLRLCGERFFCFSLVFLAPWRFDF